MVRFTLGLPVVVVVVVMARRRGSRVQLGKMRLLGSRMYFPASGGMCVGVVGGL